MSVLSLRDWFASIYHRPVRALFALLLLGVIGVGITIAGLHLWAGWHERKARQLMVRYEFDAALHHYQQCLRFWGSRASVHLAAAQAARRAGKFEEAAEHLEASYKLQGTSAELQLERVLLDALSQKEVPPTQIEDLKQYELREGAETPLVQEVLAQIYMRQPRNEEAFREVQLLLQREPDHVVALYLKGQLLGGSPNYHEAISVLKRVIELQPNHAGARKELSKLLLDEDTAASLEHVNYLLKLAPDDVMLKLRKAECLKRLGQSAEARAILDKLLEAEPDHSGILVERGILALELSDFKGAETRLRKALAKDAFNQEANKRLAEALLQQGNRREEAEKQLAFCRRQSADIERFQSIQNMSFEKLAAAPELVHECGAILLRYGRDEQALKWLFRVLAMDGTHQATHRLLADYFERKGEKERAANHRRYLQVKEGRTN
jgi:tetratricopeptide (TPR) repeat protein